MPSTFHLKIITPEAIFFSGEAMQVTAPGVMGEFGVLPGHAPFISTLKSGIVRLKDVSGEHRIAMLDGVAEVTPERCIILAEHAKSLENVSKADAAVAFQEAKDAYELAHTDELRARASAKLALAELVAQAI